MPNAGSSQRTPRAGAGHVRRGHLVEHLGVVRERLEAVREALAGSQQRAPLSARQLDAEPRRAASASPAAGRRSRRRPRRACSARACPRRAAPPGSACRAACRACALHDTLHCTSAGSRPCREALGVEGAREEAPLVACALGLDHVGARPAAVSRRITAASSSSGARARRTPAPLADVAVLRDDLVAQVPGQDQHEVGLRLAQRPRGARSGCASRAGAALLVRVAVDRVVEEVGADAAVVQQRVALGRRAVARRSTCPRALASMRNSRIARLSSLHALARRRGRRRASSSPRAPLALERARARGRSVGFAPSSAWRRRCAASRRGSASPRRRTAAGRGARRPARRSRNEKYEKCSW